MSLQEAILKQYMELNNSPTLKVISEQTGIQITRVFRLFNGSAMKLSEYVIFQELIRSQLGFDASLDELILECRKKLSGVAIQEIESMIRRKLQFHDILNSTGDVLTSRSSQIS